MASLRSSWRARGVLIAALVLPVTAAAQPGGAEPAETAAAAPKPRLQGLAVVGIGGARDEAFALARAVYASSLRPRGLDEVHARVLAGDPPPPTATKELRETGELRAAITGDDAPSRQLLATLARQSGVEGLLVVSVAPAPAADAGAAETPRAASARLFLTDSGELDAARYEPNANGWQDTVTSLARRFPPSAAPAAAPPGVFAPAKVAPPKEETPFYRSPWVWGAVGAAVLVGGIFFFTTQGSSSDPIRLQMRVPR